MQTRRNSDTSLISAIVSLILGFSASPALAQSFTCVNNGTVKVCAEWSDGDNPDHGFDFNVTFHDGDGADVELKVGDPEWRLWTTLVTGGAVTDFGEITLDPTVDGDDFTVRIWGDNEAGAVNVGSLNLDGKINNASWVGYSSIPEGFGNLSLITGDVNGVIKLVAESGTPPTGGEMGHMTILGSVTGKITIPTLSGSLQIGLSTDADSGDVDEGFEIDLLNGTLFIEGTLPANKIGEIGDIAVGAFEIDTVASGATLDLLNGMPATAGTSRVDTLAGELDLHTKDVDTNLSLGTATSTAVVSHGGTLTAFFYPSENNGEFAGTATFAGVAAGAKIWAFDNDGNPNNTSISGDITITGDYAGLFKVDGDFTGTLTIGGDLKTSSGDDGLIWIVEEASGVVTIKGDLIGHVHYPKTFAGDGSVTVEGNVTASGLFKTGDNATGETHAGNLFFEGNVVGDILIHGNYSGAIDIDGDQSGDVIVDEDLSGPVTVDGALVNAPFAGGGRILVAGESSAAIKVGEKTESLTLIQVGLGLATDGTIEINTSEGPNNAFGDIHIGRSTPAELPFDGCIRIYDQIITSSNGDLNGDIDIVMCHDDDEVLNICIDGSDNGNVTLDQTGCTNQTATWSCGTCPPA